MGEPLRIVIVEDVATDAELAAAELQRAGHLLVTQRVETAPEFARALASFRPDIVLSDYNLPAFDGLSALRMLLERAPHIPFIVVTGSINEETAVACMRAGASDYVLKENLGRLPHAVEGALRARTQAAERRRAEEALARSEERLRLAQESSGTGLWDWDVPSGRLLHEGYRPERIADPPATVGEMIDRIHPDEVPAVRAAVQAHLAGSLPCDAEFRVRACDGGWRWVRARGSVVERGPGGEPRRVIGTYEDVTERRDLEMQLRQAQKMEAIGGLAGGVAHDFNNLLTAIAGHTELGLLSLPPGSPAAEHFEQVRRAAERAAGLTGQLLAFSRKQVLQPRVLDLNGIVVETQRLLRRVIDEHITIETDLDPGVGHVKADPNQIVQVLLNLSVNARDAMPHGGALRIRTGNLDVAPGSSPDPLGLAAGPHVVLEVSDTGVGMSAEVQAQIFEPFFTTKETGQGTGLGLSTVYGIVRQSGGSIAVASRVGAGSTFRVLLPRVDAPTDDLVEREVEDRPGAHETVLLVEDDELVRGLVERTLADRGYRVVATAGPLEAMAAAERLAGPLDLLVTDVVMPTMNGRELARSLAVRRPHLRVLYMSGYTATSIVTRGILEQGLAFIQKPFHPHELGAKVRAVLDAPPGTFQV